MSSLRLAFLGTPSFAVPALAALHAAGHEIVLVVAQPDRPSGRGNKLVPPPTIQWAQAHGLPTTQPTKVRSGPFVEAMTRLGLDLAVVVAYGRILTPEVLAGPRLGCINVHASLLPRWRGAAPIQWSILAGDAETGVCCQQMAEGLDTGDVLSEVRTPIHADDTSETLSARLSELGASLVVQTLVDLPKLVPRPQDEAGVTLARILQKQDGRLDFSRSAVELDRQVRGLYGWPGTFATFRGEILKIGRVVLCEAAGTAGERVPGELLPGGRVVCGEGALELHDVQLPGRKPVSGRDFYNGARVAAGERLS